VCGRTARTVRGGGGRHGPIGHAARHHLPPTLLKMWPSVSVIVVYGQPLASARPKGAFVVTGAAVGFIR